MGSDPRPSKKPSSDSPAENGCHLQAMVKNEISVKLENLVAEEAVAPRRTIDHDRIFEPLDRGVLPRKLELDVRTANRAIFEVTTKWILNPVPAPQSNALLSIDPSRLTHPQGVGRNAAEFRRHLRGCESDGQRAEFGAQKPVDQLLRVSFMHLLPRAMWSFPG